MAGSHARERTALIATVLNESGSLDALLESVAAQTRRPDEIVIVDAGSTDGTFQRLQAWQERLPLRLLAAPAVSIARGRNLAIQATSAEIVAATDAGVRLEPDWLANLLACLAPGVDVVSGFFVPEVDSAVERAMGATVLPALEDVVPARFLPSSRSVLFRKSAWRAVGGYPEWLDYCEDLVFDLSLKRMGARFAFAPRAVARFRPRGSLAALFVQYFRYARGDGKADLWRRRHAIRYMVYAAAVLLLRRRMFGMLLAGAALYTRRPYQRLMPLLYGQPAATVVGALLLVPLIRLVGDLAKMLGYPVGVAWRVRRCSYRSSS
ncbi:MAG: glycosyltransferase [Chloroflexota bacterium]|nr:glycosyltransferase [Chloroflexota bacterium]